MFLKKVWYTFQLSCLSCKPTTAHQSRAIHAVGLMVLLGNLLFDWLVNDHVNRIAAMLERSKLRNSSADIPSLKKLHDIGLDWNAIQFVFLEFAIFTTICFALQFFGTMLTWCFTDNNKSPFQKILVWASLFLNDLPQFILTAIVTYATDDVYIPYFCSTVLGVVGNYILFLALSNIGAFHYPKVIWCHAALTVICLIIQIAHITKAQITWVELLLFVTPYNICDDFGEMLPAYSVERVCGLSRPRFKNGLHCRVDIWLLRMRHLLEGGFLRITTLWDSLIQIASYPYLVFL